MGAIKEIQKQIINKYNNNGATYSLLLHCNDKHDQSSPMHFKSEVTDDLTFDCPLHSPYDPLELPDGDEGRR